MNLWYVSELPGLKSEAKAPLSLTCILSYNQQEATPLFSKEEFDCM